MDMKYLIHELAYGDSKAAMRILYAHFYPKLMSFVYSLVKSKQDTEEIVMSTLYAVWDCQLKLAAIQNVTSYIFKIARNMTFDYLKQKKKQTDLFDPGGTETYSTVSSVSSPQEGLVESELMDRLQQAVDSLPEKSRTAFKLVREQGFKYREAAEIMEISVKTLEAHMALATRRLLSILDEEIR